jgi:hypothetical protein
MSGVKAFITGSDNNGDGIFAFMNAGAAGFNLGDGDTALDGLIVERSAGFTPIKIPLTGDSIWLLNRKTM